MLASIYFTLYVYFCHFKTQLERVNLKMEMPYILEKKSNYHSEEMRINSGE